MTFFGSEILPGFGEPGGGTPLPRIPFIPFMPFIPLAPVVQTLDSAIHRINHYPADKY